MRNLGDVTYPYYDRLIHQFVSSLWYCFCFRTTVNLTQRTYSLAWAAFLKLPSRNQTRQRKIPHRWLSYYIKASGLPPRDSSRGGPRLSCHQLAANVLGRHHVKATNCTLQLDGDIEALGVWGCASEIWPSALGEKWMNCCLDILSWGYLVVISFL